MTRRYSASARSCVIKNGSGSFHADAVAHGAKAREELIPALLVHGADDAQEAAAAKAQPLHQRELLAIEASCGGAHFIARPPVDPHRFSQGHDKVAQRRRSHQFAGKTGAVVWVLR